MHHRSNGGFGLSLNLVIGAGNSSHVSSTSSSGKPGSKACHSVGDDALQSGSFLGTAKKRKKMVELHFGTFAGTLNGEI